MTAERDSFEPAMRSTFANMSGDSVMEVFSFILPLYYLQLPPVQIANPSL